MEGGGDDEAAAALPPSNGVFGLSGAAVDEGGSGGVGWRVDQRAVLDRATEQFDAHLKRLADPARRNGAAPPAKGGKRRGGTRSAPKWEAPPAPPISAPAAPPPAEEGQWGEDEPVVID